MAGSSEEEAVGIRLFANRLPGFTGILKHRYADFKVNEVDLQGRVVRLTSLEPPQPVGPGEEEQAAAAAASADPSAAVDAAVQQYASLVGAAADAPELGPLRTFLQQALEHQAAAQQQQAGVLPEPLVLPPMPDKEQRTAVHRLFKSLPGFPKLETDTVAASDDQVEQQQKQQLDGQPAAREAQQQAQQAQQTAQQQQDAAKPQRIQLAVASSGGRSGGGRGGGRGGRGGQGQKRKRWDDNDWAGGAQRYTKFVLYKENMDSQHALSTLSKMLRASHKLFAVAGTKDKRGVTAQQVTAFKVDPARLAALNQRLRGMRLGNFEFASEQLRLGDLRGNRFELVLRNIQASSAGSAAEAEAVVAAAAAALRKSGFINYYGLQRFGSGAVPTHRIGQALLRGQWREAVRLLLTPRADCTRPDQVEAARLYLEEGDIEGALARMPRFLVAEPTLLQVLKRQGPNDFLSALMALPRNLRTIYIHAYQSYLWNSAASHRIETYGADRAVAGDLVLLQDDAARAAARNRCASWQRHEQEGAACAAGSAGGEDEAAPDATAAAGAGAAAEDEAAVAEEAAAAEAEVHVVTAEEAEAGQYSIDDVVLPLPGSETVYPQHATAEVYQQLAAADGVSLEAAPHGCLDFSIATLRGGYRRLLHRPADLEFELIHYPHPDADLASTDLMALEGKQLSPPAAAAAGGGGEGAAASGVQYLGLRLAFTLPASCYATMLIRELTKQPTSTAHHKAGTAQHKAVQDDAAAAEAK